MVTRSEERSRVEVRSVVVGRARMVTSVVTEDVTFTVPLRRQEVRLEYDDAPVAGQHGPAPSAETHEVVRHEEQVLVTTHVVPVERVRLVKRAVTTEQVVETRLCREEIDLDPAHPGGDGGAPPTG